MAEENSRVEMNIGRDEIVLEGSEQFISEGLETIFDNIEFNEINEADNPEIRGDENNSTENEPEEIRVDAENSSSGTETIKTDVPTAIREVADKLSIKPALINEHFYIEDENVHLQDSYSVSQKFALVGYCMLKREMTGEAIFDQSDTKEKLVEDERLPIEDWGSTFLYNLRENNIIKNDPDSDKERHVPFKITPKAEQEFRDWLIENEDS